MFMAAISHDTERDSSTYIDAFLIEVLLFSNAKA